MTAEEARFTRSEVATHDGRKEKTTWIIYKDSVYDVTRFMNEHPGGSDVIEGEAGRDATKEFDGVGHSSDAKKMLSKYKIGELVEDEKRYDANGKKKKVIVTEVNPSSDKLQNGGATSCMGLVSCGILA